MGSVQTKPIGLRNHIDHIPVSNFGLSGIRLARHLGFAPGDLEV